MSYDFVCQLHFNKANITTITTTLDTGGNLSTPEINNLKCMASPADLHSEGQNQKNKSQFYSARNFSDKIMLVVLSFTVFFITHAEMYIIYLVLLYIAITHIISQLV